MTWSGGAFILVKRASPWAENNSGGSSEVLEQISLIGPCAERLMECRLALRRTRRHVSCTGPRDCVAENPASFQWWCSIPRERLSRQRLLGAFR